MNDYLNVLDAPAKAGVIEISGNGVARYEGDGVLHGSIARGNLTVRDAETVDAGRYERMECLPSGAFRYFGLTGSFSMKGSDFITTIEGSGISVVARGSGNMQLRGKGTCSIDGGSTAAWSLLAWTIPLG